MIVLRRNQLITYVVKRIMKFKSKNRKKRAWFMRINNIKAYLLIKQIAASMIRSTYFHMNIRIRRSALCIKEKNSGLIACQMTKTLDSIGKEISVLHLSRHYESCWTGIENERYSAGVLQLRYGNSRHANLFVLLQKHLQPVSQQLFNLLENFVSKCCI